MWVDGLGLVKAGYGPGQAGFFSQLQRKLGVERVAPDRTVLPVSIGFEMGCVNRVVEHAGGAAELNIFAVCPVSAVPGARA
ncbi:MAG: hypothetical protein EBT27_01025 [Betaproteobacteria bacterium]|nr:hypothetical protein [Betaproteobacteria bacterium]